MYIYIYIYIYKVNPGNESHSMKKIGNQSNQEVKL